jgi:cation diffusion facilitator family transporter
MSSEASNLKKIENDHTHIITKDDIKTKKSEELIIKLAVFRAFFANIGIAGIKFFCWSLSGSSAMLSEAIHSASDGFNSVCLMIGLKRGSKPADRLHPFGYGLEANIWALFASILMLVGTFISIYNGWNRFANPEEANFNIINHYNIIAFALCGSILFEIWAVFSASTAVMEEAEIKVQSKLAALVKSFKYIHQSKNPTTKFVWYEDIAALGGVIIAFIAISIAKFLMPANQAYIPDAIASIIIGIILFALAIYLLKYNINSLTGSAAKPQIEEMIREIATKVNGITQVQDLKTMDMGSSGLIVNMEIEVDPETQVKDADDIADKLEEKIREKIKNIAHITIEVQAETAEENWSERFEKLIEEGKQTGILKPREAKMLSKFYDFTDTVVWEIMVPRTDVNFIAAEASIDELIELIINSGHTRIPVYKENIDNVTGVINAKDVLVILKNCSEIDKQKINIEELSREISIVPENKSISDMLNEFIISKSQIAAIADEHGGIAGIITVEDILEEIVGEIWDEYDVQIPDVIKIDENTLSLLSKMNIYDLNERFNLDLPTEDFQTVGGYVFGLLGREPEIGDEVEANGITMIVEETEGHKIIRVKLIKLDGFIDLQAIEEDSQE